MKAKIKENIGKVTSIAIDVDGCGYFFHDSEVDDNIELLGEEKSNIDTLRYDAAKSILLAKINSGCSWTMAEVVSMADELVSKLSMYENDKH